MNFSVRNSNYRNDKTPYEAASMTIVRFSNSGEVITDSGDNGTGGGHNWSTTSIYSLDEDLLTS